jgi:hypothetical protein
VRIWSLHPKYLDSKGLVALWRETLLARQVLEGKTEGYKNHPQLERFKNQKKPINSINVYLQEIYNEAQRRNYNFDRNKINWKLNSDIITVTSGQIDFEAKHLLNKLKIRDQEKFRINSAVKTFICHPLFKVVSGDTEKWEKL